VVYVHTLTFTTQVLMLLLSSDGIIFCTCVNILLGLFIYSGGSLFSLGFRVTGNPSYRRRHGRDGLRFKAGKLGE
jgi:hypothetical protein